MRIAIAMCVTAILAGRLSIAKSPPGSSSSLARDECGSNTPNRRACIYCCGGRHPSREPLLQRRCRERIAVLRPAGIEAALEPARALRRGAVREGLRHHAPLRLLLQAVIADRSSRIERFFDVSRIELVHQACLVAPYAGIAVGLQLHAHRDIARTLRAGVRRFEPAELAG